MGKRAVLMLAYGTPATPDEIPAYLRDVREGREPSPELVDEIRERYRLIGGSPLTRLTQAQADAVRDELARRGHAMPVYVGMRHAAPWIRDTVAQMKADGVEEAVAIVMAPHTSSVSTGRYRRRVEEVLQATGASFRVRFVAEWWHQPRLLDTWAQLVREGFSRLRAQEDAIALVFTAHSLPVRLLQEGDTYEDQLRAMADAVAGQVGWPDWIFRFQSAGASPGPWLGPSLDESLTELNDGEYRAALVAPIGFVCDHVETLFDIDHEAKRAAEEMGIELERTDLPNTRPGFIAAVADAILGVGNAPERVS